MIASPHQTPDDARPAASLLLLRDGPQGLEVLMLRRAERDGDMRSGAAVFPGGVLDAGDHQAAAQVLGLDDAAASARLGLSAGGLAFWVAALRETFEEVGMLLADRAVDVTALAPWRERLQRGDAAIADLCAEQGLRLDLREVAYYSHWLTPRGVPKRFDTRFFVARAPAGQDAEADLREAVELMWLTPRAALAHERGLKLLPVTRHMLQHLAGFADVAGAWATLTAPRDIRLTLPRVATARGQRTVVLPGEWCYAEIGRLDPHGHGQAAAELVAGVAVRLSGQVWRVTAPNPGPMTGPGTNSYLVGSGAPGAGWTVIDPGPADAAHVQALCDAAAQAGGPITRILVTHTHRDHSPGAAPLAAATGAPVWGRLPAHPMGQDSSFVPAHQPVHGERIALGSGATLRVLHTPGHASNHLCFLLDNERLLFTGDHVMQGSTVVINPPDGDMAAYLRALDALLAEDLDWLAPGHGFLIAEPHAVLRRLIAHRLKREAKVAAALRAAGPAALEDLLGAVYDDVPAALHGVAQRSLLAHLIKLQADGVARVDGEVWSAA